MDALETDCEQAVLMATCSIFTTVMEEQALEPDIGQEEAKELLARYERQNGPTRVEAKKSGMTEQVLCEFNREGLGNLLKRHYSRIELERKASVACPAERAETKRTKEDPSQTSLGDLMQQVKKGYFGIEREKQAIERKTPAPVPAPTEAKVSPAKRKQPDENSLVGKHETKLKRAFDDPLETVAEPTINLNASTLTEGAVIRKTRVERDRDDMNRAKLIGLEHNVLANAGPKKEERKEKRGVMHTRPIMPPRVKPAQQPHTKGHYSTVQSKINTGLHSAINKR